MFHEKKGPQNSICSNLPKTCYHELTLVLIEWYMKITKGTYTLFER